MLRTVENNRLTHPTTCALLKTETSVSAPRLRPPPDPLILPGSHRVFIRCSARGIRNCYRRRPESGPLNSGPIRANCRGVTSDKTAVCICVCIGRYPPSKARKASFPLGVCFLFIWTWRAHRPITVRKQTYKTGRGLGAQGDVKINIPGAAKSRLSRALLPAPLALPPGIPLTRTPATRDRPPIPPSPFQPRYKTFNLNVKLKRNGFRSRNEI